MHTWLSNGSSRYFVPVHGLRAQNAPYANRPNVRGRFQDKHFDELYTIFVKDEGWWTHIKMYVHYEELLQVERPFVPVQRASAEDFSQAATLTLRRSWRDTKVTNITDTYSRRIVPFSIHEAAISYQVRLYTYEWTSCTAIDDINPTPHITALVTMTSSNVGEFIGWRKLKRTGRGTPGLLPPRFKVFERILGNFNEAAKESSDADQVMEEDSVPIDNKEYTPIKSATRLRHKTMSAEEKEFIPRAQHSVVHGFSTTQPVCLKLYSYNSLKTFL